MRSLGAQVQDPANLPGFKEYIEGEERDELGVAMAEFEDALNGYLTNVEGGEVKSMVDIIK